MYATYATISDKNKKGENAGIGGTKVQMSISHWVNRSTSNGEAM